MFIYVLAYYLFSVVLLYFFVYKTVFFFLPKQSQKSRYILSDGSSSLEVFRKGKTRIKAKLHWTDVIISSCSRERKTPSYSQINTVFFLTGGNLKVQR